MSAVLEAQEPSARYLADSQPSLVRQFEMLATAPGGVARLRELILTLAVRGTLVPQRPSDEPAAVLLEKTRSERGRLGAGDKFNRDAQPPTLEMDNQPFDLPIGWEWSCLAEIGRWAVGSGFPHEAQGREGLPILFAKVSDMNLPGNELEITRTNHTIDAETVDRLRINVHPAGTVIFPKIGGAIATNKRRILIRPTAIDNNCLGITPCQSLSTEYLFLLLASIDFTAYQAGTSVPALSQGTLGKIVVGLPPQAEQSRIVARVNELMRLCDALEAKGRLEAEQHARLLGTLLGTLTDSSTPEELATNWQRVADHFDLLLDRPEAVDALEQTILQLAVRGLLLPQDPSEEPASVLIEQIRDARAGQLSDASRRKARAELPEVEQDEWPFAPPPGWAWTRFGEVTQVSGGVTLGRKGAIASPVSRPYLRVANVQRWKLALDSMKDIVIDEAELPRYQLAEGDLLITEGGDWDKVGRTAIWRSELPECLHQNHVFKARGYTTTWNPSWAELYLNLDVARAYFAASAKQTTNLASINMTELRHCVFPLPPLNEQARIIARVTELRRVCAELRQCFAASQTTQAHLAEAMIDEVA